MSNDVVLHEIDARGVATVLRNRPDVNNAYDEAVIQALPDAMDEVGAILSNYRDAKVGGIPEAAILDVLVRLAKAAAQAGKLPRQAGHSAPMYGQLVEVLAQLGREKEIM